MKGAAALSTLLALALLSAGQGRSLHNDGALELFNAEIDTSVMDDQDTSTGVVSIHAANSAAINIASLLEEPMWDDVEGGPKCKVKCNGKNVTSSEDNGKKPYSCWGFFTAFCKGHSKKACGAGGFVCKGHFVGAKFPGGKAAVCEGELKSFGAKFIKAKGKKVAVFKKGGCLGTSSLIGLNTSDEESAQGLQWPASLPQVWEENYEGSELLSSGSKEPLAQGRCSGFGGGFKAVKVSSGCGDKECEEHQDLPQAERKEMTLTTLQEKVNETMLDMGVPEVMPSYMSVGIEPVFQEASQNGGCKITCNGKPAWFKGQLPCFGKLEVKCFAGEEAPKYAPDFFAASCKGFWSGIFGHRCKGQATGFVASEYYKKLNICTGTFGMFAKAKKSEGKFATGKFCAGKSLGAFFLGEDEEDNAMIAKAA
ncbi:g10604 [Coccomyxa viridis]|uniref:G10604 protein n=1 Tax=Coccomyxa viridis TaxID=1274662 RepID=A0ABP1G724_9CHLO